MRLGLFVKLALISLCISLLAFALAKYSFIDSARLFALEIVLSIAVTAFYPDFRGIKTGDQVAVVTNDAVPSLLARFGRAAGAGKKSDRIKIILDNGTEVLGTIESYPGLISPGRIKVVYEERLVEQ